MSDLAKQVEAILRLDTRSVWGWRVCDFNKGEGQNGLHFCTQDDYYKDRGIVYHPRCWDDDAFDPVQSRGYLLSDFESQDVCERCARDFLHCVGADDMAAATARRLSKKMLCETEACSHYATRWGGIAGSSATIFLCQKHFTELDDEDAFYMSGENSNGNAE